MSTLTPIKKICHMTSVHKSNDVRIFSKECSSLAEAGYDIYLVSADGIEKDVNGVKIRGVSVKHNNRFQRMLKVTHAVYKKAILLDAEIYHFHDPELLFWGLVLKLKGKKVIYDSHEDLPRQIISKEWINLSIRKVVSVFFELVEDTIVRFLDAVVAATPVIQARFVKINKNSVDVNNYPMLNELSSCDDWSKKKNQICYIGGITRVRSIVQIVKAMESVDAKLILAGMFSDAELEKEVRALKGWEKVEYQGYINRGLVGQLLQQSLAGVVVLEPTGNNVNSQPTKMFEYMISGIPVIASNFPLWVEFVKANNCGLCVDPNNIAEIASAMNYILKNQEAAQRMGQSGRQSVFEKYNWKSEEKKLLEVYKKLI